MKVLINQRRVIISRGTCRHVSPMVGVYHRIRNAVAEAARIGRREIKKRVRG